MIKIKFNLLQIVTMNLHTTKHHKKKFQSVGILPVSLHAFMKTLKKHLKYELTA